MKTDELREKYLKFFESKGHKRCPSDVLVPTWDPSVLFTPAGMNQFKDHFLGKVKLEFTRATTCQKCLRTGDIDNVGRTAYHHTFFEMLGNFSFGDYFKREAIHWAWEFLTRKEWLGLDPKRLTVSVYHDDDEAAQIWMTDIKLPADRIERMGEDDNFWPAGAPSKGPDGVCGPCSEIFFHPDQGKSVEIWNLVFTQFNRVGDAPNNLRPLPSRNIDTGMGLERTAAVLQGVTSNFHIDILKPIVLAAAEICGVPYDPASDNGRRLRRITDHVRACAFAIHEHVSPGANKQKYVVRRLLRRAVLDGRQMGVREPFLHQLVPVVADMMKSPYPELSETVQRVANTIRAEEANFFGTIDAGLAKIERVFTDMASAGRVIVQGEEAADLYQTYGVPPELFESMASDRGLTFDWDGFREAMTRHGEKSGKIADIVFATGPMESLKASVKHTQFLGYETTSCDAVVKGIVAKIDEEERLCAELSAGEAAPPVKVVLDRSPFYGESGGQVGDSGEITGPGFRFQVTDTQKDADLVVHFGQVVEGKLVAGGACRAVVNDSRRQAIRRAHSATHILHHALQKNLGRHAQQQGSKVDEDWLRFDFTHMSPVTPEELSQIERDAQARVAERAVVAASIVPLAEARQAGAMMLFGEKYPDPVRMISMGEFSRELCGGTHLGNTGEVGPFEIIAEEAVSAGTRRIVALTGEKARVHEEQTRAALGEAAGLLGVGPLDVPAGAKNLAQQVRELRKQIAAGTKSGAQPASQPMPPATSAPADFAQMKTALRDAARALNVAPFDVPARVTALVKELDDLRRQQANMAAVGDFSADILLAKAEDVGATKVIVVETPGASSNLMRQLIDQLRRKSSSTAILLAAATGDDKVTLVAGLSRDLVERGLSAGNWVRDAAAIVGGSGGGKADMAQAGGKDPAKLPEAVRAARDQIRQALQA
ncbi:MAG: alanine--tRNA ligase [Pirellulaceae bacterium]